MGRENLGTNAKKKWSEQKGSIQGRQYLLFLPQTLTISVTLLKLCNRYSGPTSLRCFLSPHSRDEDEERQEPTNDYSVFFFLFMLLLPFSHERTFLGVYSYILYKIYSVNCLIYLLTQIALAETKLFKRKHQIRTQTRNFVYKCCQTAC